MNDLLNGLLGEVAVFRDADLGSVRGAWAPLARVPGIGLLEHAVDLLEGKALGLWHEEVRVDECAGAETTPEEEDGRAEVGLVRTDKVGSDDGDDRIPKPVRCGRERNTSGSDREREDLADDDPCTGTPSRCKEENEDSNEGNLRVDGANVLRDLEAVGIGRSELCKWRATGMLAEGLHKQQRAVPTLLKPTVTPTMATMNWQMSIPKAP